MIERRISADQAGQRLDKFLKRCLPTVPVSHLYKLVRTRKVRVNGRRAGEETLLAEGDLVTIRGDEQKLLAPATPEGLRRSSFTRLPPLHVLHEDPDLLAVDKPAGLAVHPGSGISGATLVELARAHVERQQGPAPTGDFLASPGHRLDRDTSGVVLVAKSRRCMVRLTELFTAGRVKKRYLALVKGRFSSLQGTIDLPLAEHEQTSLSRARHGVKLQSAITHYQVVASGKQASLLVCRIETGRTHQIRRHLAAIGHPVLGDRRHGDFNLNRQLKSEAGLDRMFLHAERLELQHPTRATPLVLEASLPEELVEVLLRLGISTHSVKLATGVGNGKDQFADDIEDWIQASSHGIFYASHSSERAFFRSEPCATDASVIFCWASASWPSHSVSERDNTVPPKPAKAVNLCSGNWPFRAPMGECSLRVRRWGWRTNASPSQASRALPNSLGRFSRWGFRTASWTSNWSWL